MFINLKKIIIIKNGPIFSKVVVDSVVYNLVEIMVSRYNHVKRKKVQHLKFNQTSLSDPTTSLQSLTEQIFRKEKNQAHLVLFAISAPKKKKRTNNLPHPLQPIASRLRDSLPEKKVVESLLSC